MRYEQTIWGQREVKGKIFGKSLTFRLVVLPLPPSVNKKVEPNYAAIRHMMNTGSGYKGLVKNSTEYNSWVNFARTQLMKKKLPSYEGQIFCSICFVFKDKTKNDVDNRIKPLLDSFTQSKCLIKDDNDVKTLVATKMVIPKTEVVIAVVVKLDDMQGTGFQELMLNEYFVRKLINAPSEK